MKKTLAAALTTALVLGAASTTFAAANPFSDVPADHWAYDAVAQLAKDGVIEGYGDTTFQGNKNITRYEMAQMVAKAMAKANVSTNDAALIDKLKAEFSDELNNLGVRVANLEKKADKVKRNGEARFRNLSYRYEGQKKDNSYPLQFRLLPSAEVNDNWHVKARLTATTKMDTDSSDDASAKLTYVYADGQYKNFGLKLGKMPLFSTSDAGLVADDFFTGGQLSFGNKLKATLEGGRFNMASEANSYLGSFFDKNSAADYAGLDLAYENGKLGFGAGYRYFKNDGFKKVDNYKDSKSKTDKADIWSVGTNYKFDNNWTVLGSYAKNEKADNYAASHNVELDYKGASNANAGTWGAYAAYRYLGENVSIVPTYDTFTSMTNKKGWEVGADYVPFKNIHTYVSYFDGKDLQYRTDAKMLFGRLSFFF
ncbi:S-layer homology domain-containing protein [Mitsuokella sp.]|uniref:S-layer homology domain-containing protein n=1 Tax=Mitsuokella sp. TaxID=2049034 RepID=UPI003D7EE235